MIEALVLMLLGSALPFWPASLSPLCRQSLQRAVSGALFWRPLAVLRKSLVEVSALWVCLSGLLGCSLSVSALPWCAALSLWGLSLCLLGFSSCAACLGPAVGVCRLLLGLAFRMRSGRGLCRQRRGLGGSLFCGVCPAFCIGVGISGVSDTGGGRWWVLSEFLRRFKVPFLVIVWIFVG